MIRSESWDNDRDIDNIYNILTQSINDFVEEEDRIINIEMKEHNGSFRFWIYYESPVRGE